MTKAIRTETVATVYRVEAAGHSRMGNPRFEFHTSAGKMKTAVDSGKAYQVRNDYPVGAGIDMQVKLIRGGWGNIVDWELN